MFGPLTLMFTKARVVWIHQPLSSQAYDTPQDADFHSSISNNTPSPHDIHLQASSDVHTTLHGMYHIKRPSRGSTSHDWAGSRPREAETDAD